MRPLAEHQISDSEFGEYLFLRDNPKGVFLERWRHQSGCRRWFNIVRDTYSHEIIETYAMGATPKSKPAKLPISRAGGAKQPQKLLQNRAKEIDNVSDAHRKCPLGQSFKAGQLQL